MSVTHSFFRKVFTRYFNIGFGTPRQDVCSTCIQITEQIKHEKSVAEKQKLMTNLRIHKLRAKAFFLKLREENDDLLTLSFDCQKNLPLPKVADQAAYYSRQLYLYNFTAVIGSSHSVLQKSNVRSYLWTEDISAKSSNEISSAVYHCLNSFDLHNIKTVRLMADGCGGQNKNSIMIGMVSKWFSEAPATLKRVEIIFPVTGHSFLPADRVFALTEKRVRKIETIVKPEEYENIISEHAEIFKLGTEVPIYDFRSAVKETLKDVSRWHFQITKVKRVVLKRGKTTRRILARGELSYQNDTGVAKCLLRPTRNFTHLVPDQLSVGVKVTEAKLNDVKKLLIKHFGQKWLQLDYLSFYRNIFERDSNVETREDDACCEQEMEEILDFV
ncbi:jg26512 [Pararge aegeria aegeria]|uniref:Jg26512 protein n=3 Tax=Pararge aegeria TaxID=116150 RepID=A0A8S4QBJ4_9NEOP|nr:jg26512 [Pararge aegeria aegeria]